MHTQLLFSQSYTNYLANKMKNIVFILMGFIVTLQIYSQKLLQLEDCRQLALTHNKNLKIAQENIKATKQLKEAAFTQFLPNFSANGTYSWNEKNLSLLSENGILPVGTKMGDGSFGFTMDQISNKWTTLNGTAVPLDAAGVPFNPTKSPEKILWKNYALLPKNAMEFDIKNIFVGSIGFVQPIFMGGKIQEIYHIASLAHIVLRTKSPPLSAALLKWIQTFSGDQTG